MLCVYTWPHPSSFRGIEITTQQQLAWTVSINVSRPRSSFWTSVFSEMNWDFSWKNAKPRRREGWLWAGPGTTHIVTVECSGTAWRSQGDTRAMQRDLHCLHLPCTVGVWGSVMIVGDHTAVRRRVCESAVEEKLMEKREMLSLNAECQLTNTGRLMGRWKQGSAELLLSELTGGQAGTGPEGLCANSLLIAKQK